MRRLISVVMFLTIGIGVQAQTDPVFTQMQNAPLYLNPGLVGIYYGGSRYNMVVRDQWASVAPSLKNSHVSYDQPIIDNIHVNDYLGAGISISSELTELSRMSAHTASLSVNYGKGLDPFSRHFVAIGIQGGARQLNISTGGLNWEKQWDRFDFIQGAPSGEILFKETKIHPEFALGGVYVFNNERSILFKTGISMYHVHKPKISFLGAEFQQYRRLNIHSDIKIGAHGSTFSFWPKVIYSIQGPDNMLQTGFDLHWLTQEAGNITGATKEVTFSIGPHIRWGDAVAIFTQLTVGGLGIGVSYDFTFMSVSQVTKLGGPEVAMIYKTGYKKGRREKHKHRRFQWKTD